MAHTYRIGDLVRSRFGEDLMAVSHVGRDSVRCEWTDADGDLQQAFFPPEWLVPTGRKTLPAAPEPSDGRIASTSD
jgi:uncharacterized protein YodC (DUF2158 family)